MNKQICWLQLLIVFALSCPVQNKVYQKNTAQAGNDNAKPKIINPEGETPFPYSHFVSCGLQDKTGNLWFGTSDGVFRFDGKLFTNYRVMDGLPVDHVSRIMEDKAGDLWFGATGGVVRYSPSVTSGTGSVSFTSIQIPETTGRVLSADMKNNPDVAKAANSVTQIMEGRNGVIWFCAGYNLYRTDGKSGVAKATGTGEFLKSEKAKVSCGDPDDFGICGIYEDQQGNILLSVVSCCCCFNVTYRLNAAAINNPCVLNACKHNLHNPQQLAAHNKELAASFTKITGEADNANIAFTCVLKDRKGNVWMGSCRDSGVYMYNGRRFIPFAKNDKLDKSGINNIYEDKSGNIWFSTGEANAGQGNGVFCYNGRYITRFTAKNGLCNTSDFKSDFVSCMMEDNTGKIWFGGYGGICWYNGKTFTNFTSKDGFNQQPVNCIVKDKAGNLWFGTWNLGLYRYDGKSLTCFTENKNKL
jgi:hypothetical protein